MFQEERQSIDCSIIIPAYNAVDTIKDCLGSIRINESIPISFEIIIINDGSCDNTESVVLDYIKNSSNYKFITIENQGVSNARNLGIKHAQGRYIFFMDADDTIDVNVLYDCVEIANRNNYDLVIADYELINCSTCVSEKVICSVDHDVALDKNYIINTVFSQIFTSGSKGVVNMWNKLYRRDVLQKNEIYFDTEQIYGEDLLFNLKYFDNINTAFAVSKSLYYYKYSGLTSYKKTDYSYSLYNLHAVLKDYNKKYSKFFDDDKEYLIFENNFFNDIVYYLKNSYITYNQKQKFIKNKEVQDNLKFVLNNYKRKNIILNKREVLAILLLKYNFCKLALKVLK